MKQHTRRHLHRSLALVSLSTLAVSMFVLLQPATAQTPAAKTTTPKTIASPSSASQSVTPKAESIKAVATPPAALQEAVATTSASKTSGAITININGRTVEADPAPVLQKGSVLVPLRGVLESLGAKVIYDAASSRIDITQNGQQYSLRTGQSYAVAGARVVPLASAPVLLDGRAFVPLRSLAELFGYRVQWLPSTRTVAIANDSSAPVLATADHKAALASAGRFGVGINFHDAAPGDVEKLLDAARDTGATLVKFRFDWNALEPEKGGTFQWPIYDRIVREARQRGLTVVGILGNTPRWATRLPNSKEALEWRNSAPLAKELPAWENYVRRVVGRYKNDVQAWQVWENPATYNFRGGEAKDYRVLTRRASEIARAGDPKAVIFAAEPGGVNLGFVNELQRNGLLPHVNGVALYPVSQWQPGVVAQPEETLLPVATLVKDPDMRGEEYWVGGLSRLSLETPDLQLPKADTLFRTKDHDLRRRLAQTFTPAAQADYLVRSMTLSLASGVDKIFWTSLRDEPVYDLVDPVNSQYGGGLLRPDMTPRPSYEAYSLLARLLAGKRYLGALSAGPGAVALVFENPKTGEGSAVAWAIPGHGETKLVLNPEHNPDVPDSLFIGTLADSKLLDATGNEVGGGAGSFSLTSRPLWITRLAFNQIESLRSEKNGAPPLRLVSNDATEFPASGLRAVFAAGSEGREDGLAWRKYSGFRGAAFEFKEAEGQSGLLTTYSRDIYNPAAGDPYIYLDVANNYLYFAHGVPVQVTVQVKRPAKLEGVFAPQAGFNIQYDSPSGFKLTPWQTVEGGDGWVTYTIDIPDASFANRDGYDLLINTWGSRQDLLIRSLTLKRSEARDVRVEQASTGESTLH
jgi:hypothetical protein